MKEKTITYVTNNWAKIESAKQALAPLGYIIENIKIDNRHKKILCIWLELGFCIYS